MAYCLDDAIGFFGNFIEAAVLSVEGKNSKDTAGRQKLQLRRLLKDGPVKTARQFADPVAMGKVTVNKVG